MDGTRLREWRSRLGLTQAEVAAKFKVTRMTVQNWESGITAVPPPIEAASQLAEHEFRKRPSFGPVTLAYSDGPMFVNPYGPRRGSMLQREPYASNAHALERVAILWGRNDFYSPLIVDEGGCIVWNAVELRKWMETKIGPRGLQTRGSWYEVMFDRINKDELVAERNAHHVMSTCVSKYIEGGLPPGVTIFRDLSRKDQYIYYFSNAAFALASDAILNAADAVNPCDEPSDLTNLRQIPL
jgi:transcriptional regulator with XRE-family HTH domain